MAKLVRPNKLYLTGLYFRCLRAFALQGQDFIFAEFKFFQNFQKEAGPGVPRRI